MNFRTTIILIVLLALVGLGLFLTREKSAQDVSETTTTKDEGTKLLDLPAADVTKISIAGSEQPIVLERTGIDWKLVQPVSAPAENSAAQTLADWIVNLRIKGKAPAIDKPRFKIELTTKDGKTTKLNVGQRSATGNNLYVQREGESQSTIVAADLFEQLDKPVSAFRRAKLFNVASNDVKQLKIATTQSTIALEKHGADWQVVEPTKMPAENTEVSDLLFAITNLKADEFVAEQVDDPKRRRLDAPQLTVEFSTQAPATQPITQPTTAPTFTTVKFGGYTDVTRKNVYAIASDSPALVSVSASSVETFTSKKPLDLRDRKVVSIDPQQVSRLTIVTDKPATTRPTTREASHVTIAIERAPVASTQPTTIPTTQPTTAPSTQASTQPMTVPVEKPSKWLATFTPPLPPPPAPFIGEATPNVDRRVEGLLASLRTLRTTKYLEGNPTTQPTDRYELIVETVPAGSTAPQTDTLTLRDRGETDLPLGEYNGLVFEAPRALLDAVKADWSKPQPASGIAPIDEGASGADLQPDRR